MKRVNMRDALWNSLEEVFESHALEGEIDDFILALQKNGYVLRRAEFIRNLQELERVGGVVR